MESTFHWYALEVMHRKEKATADALRRKDFDCYLPLYDSRRVWSDRIKVQSMPLFGGYLFCRLEPRQRRLPILTTPGVRRFVGASGEPEPIPDCEIDAIKAALASGYPLEPADSLEAGDRVRVKIGALAGLEGSFVRFRGSERLILMVPLIQRSVAVEIDRAFIEACTRSVPHDPFPMDGASLRAFG